jgi:hypothetical protein
MEVATYRIQFYGENHGNVHQVNCFYQAVKRNISKIKSIMVEFGTLRHLVTGRGFGEGEL